MPRPRESRTCPWMLLAAGLALAGIAGCGAGVKTYPVKGKVVFKGGKPVPDGRVQFQSTDDPKVRALGDIGADGSFSLTTYVGGKNVAGAVAGSHTVTVELERPAAVVALPKPLIVKPEDNDFPIEIPARRR
jgi:hypothetical protein